MLYKIKLSLLCPGSGERDKKDDHYNCDPNSDKDGRRLKQEAPERMPIEPIQHIHFFGGLPGSCVRCHSASPRCISSLETVNVLRTALLKHSASVLPGTGGDGSGSMVLPVPYCTPARRSRSGARIRVSVEVRIPACYCPSRKARTAGASCADSHPGAKCPQSPSRTRVFAPISRAKSSAGCGFTI
jgi:hypothetical protein